MKKLGLFKENLITTDGTSISVYFRFWTVPLDFRRYRTISDPSSVFGQLLSILNTPVRFWTSSFYLARSDVGRSCAISNDSGGFQLRDTNAFFVMKKTTTFQAVTILVTKAGRKKQRLIWQRKSPSWQQVFGNHIQRIRCNVL